MALALRGEAKQTFWSPWQLQGFICLDQQLLSHLYGGLGLIRALNSLTLHGALINMKGAVCIHHALPEERDGERVKSR